MNRNRIVFLDYLRILAFALVVIGHQFNKDLYAAASNPNLHITLRALSSIIADASFGGAMGVVLFFLISGYIITHVLHKEGALEFFVKRFFRIYPLYVFSVTLELFFQHTNGHPIPPINVILPRILLIGDFFDTPLALGQVEWTLRIEVGFYIFMGLIRWLGLINNALSVLVIFLTATALLYCLGPLPLSKNFHNGYLSIFAPFLMIGVLLHYVESKSINTTLAALAITFIFYTHLYMAQSYTPTWIRFNYSIVGCAIFIGSMLVKNMFIVTVWGTFLSELTYAVYLIHKWAWGLIASLVANLKIPLLPYNIQIVVILLLVCAICHRLIERNGIKLGKRIIVLLNKHKT